MYIPNSLPYRRRCLKFLSQQIGIGKYNPSNPYAPTPSQPQRRTIFCSTMEPSPLCWLQVPLVWPLVVLLVLLQWYQYKYCFFYYYFYQYHHYYYYYSLLTNHYSLQNRSFNQYITHICPPTMISTAVWLVCLYAGERIRVLGHQGGSGRSGLGEMV